MPTLPRNIALGLLLALGVGCAGVPSPRPNAVRPIVEPAPEAVAPIRQAVAIENEHDVAAQEVPISLSVVFLVAEEKNPKLAAAREAIEAANARRELADKAWVPELYVGTAYNRHEGGIQLQEGPLISSSTGNLFAGLAVGARVDPAAILAGKLAATQQLLTKNASLRRQTAETLLEAASTYIDLMAAHVVLREAQRLEVETRQLLDRARTRAELDRKAGLDVLRLEAELIQQRQTVASTRQSVETAAARVVYLLGFEAEQAATIHLMPTDAEFVPLKWFDASTATEALVSRALASGPGIEELRQLIAVAQQGQETARHTALLPTVGVRVLEGPFGAGANSTLAWANRFDIGLEAGWTLPRPGTMDASRRAANAQIREAQFTLQELRNQLAFAVREAAEAVRTGEQQLVTAEEQICQARRIREVFRERAALAPASVTESDALAVVRAEQAARLNYIQVLTAYNKAQVRLMIFVAATGMKCSG